MTVLRADSFLGRAARLPLRLIRPGRVVPIMATPARGKKWIVGSGPHSNWLGFNEIAKRRMFARLVHPGNTVYDIGANAGSYTILASCLVGPTGVVVAFEPVAENVRYLRQHVSINRLDNVRIVPMAVFEANGAVSFEPTDDRVLGRIDPAGSIRVPCTTVDAFWTNDGRAPQCIKIDVEGGEVAVLRGAARVMRKCRPIIFVATHSASLDAECRRLLIEGGYFVHRLAGHPDELIASPEDHHGADDATCSVPREYGSSQNGEIF